jgi:hypothetical protein
MNSKILVDGKPGLAVVLELEKVEVKDYKDLDPTFEPYFPKCRCLVFYRLCSSCGTPSAVVRCKLFLLLHDWFARGRMESNQPNFCWE